MKVQQFYLGPLAPGGISRLGITEIFGWTMDTEGERRRRKHHGESAQMAQ